MKRVIFCFFLFLSATFTVAQESIAQPVPQTGVYLDTFWVSGNDTLLYRMLLPPGFSFSQKYPLILFLHGMGERGSDNKRQLTHGSRLFSDSISAYPSIVLFPQCPETDYWANLDRSQFEEEGMRLFRFRTDLGSHPSLGMVMEMVSHYRTQRYADTSRFYLAGLSMGAMGTFDLLWRMPGVFAAAIPICGAGPLDKVDILKDTPLWIFHGAKDKTVDPDNSVKMVNALQNAGAEVRFTMYPEAGHNSWDNAFAEPEFFRWLFLHVK